MDEKALADAQAATAVLVRQGKVAEPVGAMVIPAQRGGVLGAVGGRDGELYVNGRALTREWADRLRTLVPELSSDVDRLQAMRARQAVGSLPWRTSGTPRASGPSSHRPKPNCSPAAWTWYPSAYANVLAHAVNTVAERMDVR